MAEPKDDKRIAVDTVGSPDEIVAQLVGIHPADIAAALERLDSDAVTRVLYALDEETAADVLINLDEHVLAEVLEQLRPPEIAEFASELDSDDAADVIGLLDSSKRALVLDKLDENERAEVEGLLRYEVESAGGIMASELVYVNDDAKCQDAIEVVRGAAEELENIHYVYVTDRDRRLKGVLPLYKLVVARPDSRVSNVMDPDVVSASAEMDREDVASLFSKYDLVAMPVVDAGGVLVGRITVDDIIDVIQEEADEDISIMAGTSEEELHEESAMRVSRIRLPWLVVGALGGLASASVMNYYRLSLEKVLALAFFVPVITAMGGNVGLQTSTIIVRGMHSDGGFSGRAASRLLREWRVAITNAILLGGAVYSTVGFWLGDWRLASVVGGSLALVILVAATLGTVMPFTLKRIGIDPAVAQGPFVTTLNDIIGIMVYLGLASVLIERLG
jgi:magnesium transporter